MAAELFTQLGLWKLGEGYKSAIMRGLGGQHMAPGSQNAKVTGKGFIRASNGPLLLAGKIGSRQLFLIDQSYAGLGLTNVAVQGSIYQVKELLMYCGSGRLSFDGVALDALITASSTLSYVKRVAGVYAPGATTGPFQAGRAQPSAPILYPKDVPSLNHTAMSGAVAVEIARASTIDNQPSLASLPSNIVILSGQSAIVQIPSADANGQDIWLIYVPRVGFIDLGVFYALPTSLGGQVTEAALAYTRAAGNVTFTAASDTATVTGGVTSADVGRRISSASFDTWVTEIVDGTHVTINDLPGGTTTEAGTITHAIDGILRAVEISWTNGAISQQDVAPDRAFPPPAVDFSGSMNDVLWAEAAGIIYVSDPGFMGSFPPSNALFAPGAAVLFLKTAKGLTIRFERHNVGALYYVGGSPALEYQTFIENQGIKYAQNAGLGAGGRVCAWLGQPTVVNNNSLEPDFSYAADVMPEFEGWDETQTALRPICFGYDGLGKYECWMLGKKIMAKHAPTGDWCAPEDVTDRVTGDIVAAVTFDHKLYLSSVNGAALTLYQYDAGTGTVMIVRTDEWKSGSDGDDTINLVMAQIRADNMAHNIKIEVVSNFDESAETVYDALPVKLGTQLLPTDLMRPNILNVEQHALRFTIESVGGVIVDGVPYECGIDWARTKGSTSDTV